MQVCIWLNTPRGVAGPFQAFQIYLGRVESILIFLISNFLAHFSTIFSCFVRPVDYTCAIKSSTTSRNKSFLNLPLLFFLSGSMASCTVLISLHTCEIHFTLCFCFFFYYIFSVQSSQNFSSFAVFIFNWSQYSSHYFSFCYSQVFFFFFVNVVTSVASLLVL